MLTPAPGPKALGTGSAWQAPVPGRRGLAPAPDLSPQGMGSARVFLARDRR